MSAERLKFFYYYPVVSFLFPADSRRKFFYQPVSFKNNIDFANTLEKKTYLIFCIISIIIMVVVLPSVTSTTTDCRISILPQTAKA